MDSVDRKRLRELAMAATPGPWYDAGCCTVHDANHYEVAHPFDCANVPFIAAANPQTILALLDALDAVCRALIARDEALREIRGHADFRAFDENDASCLRGQLLTIADTADLALTDDGKHEQQTGHET